MRIFTKDNGEIKELGGNGITAVTGLDYSTAEQDTGRKWIDGKPVYMRTFTGNIAGAAETNIYADLMSGADTIISAKGWWLRGGTNYDKILIGVNYTFVSSAANTFAYVFLRDSDKMIRLGSISPNARTGTDNNAYQVCVEYTKA